MPSGEKHESNNQDESPIDFKKLFMNHESEKYIGNLKFNTFILHKDAFF